MRRVLVVAAGVLLAFFAGCCFLVTALLVESFAMPAETGLALFNVVALLLAHLQDGQAAHLLSAGARAVWTTLVGVCFAPVLVVALLGETAGVRALVWSAGATGLLTAALPTLLRASMALPASAATSLEGRVTLILFLTGIAAGTAYWAVAGWRAASWPRR